MKDLLYKLGYPSFIDLDMQKDLSGFPSHIPHILPVALALLLPGIGMYSNTEMPIPNRIGFFTSWLFGSILLYTLWYLLWSLWEWKTNLLKRRVGILSFLGFAGAIIVVNQLILSQGMGELGELKWPPIFRLILASVLFVAIQYAIKTQENIVGLLVEKEQIQTENYRVQLQALRAKIDPHFLFNSLNTLRSMVRQQHINSEEFILSLSQFYRQTLKHNDNTSLSLAEELEVLESYLFLMKSRNEDAISIKIDIDPALHELHLPTLALQIVIENCFKHNSMSSKQPLYIEIRDTEDHYLVVENNIQPKIGNHEASGYGLDLLRKRYELMNVQSGILVQERDNQFRVQLKLM